MSGSGGVAAAAAAWGLCGGRNGIRGGSVCDGIVALVMRVVAVDVFRRSDRATCGSFSRENICRCMSDDLIRFMATPLDYRQWKKDGGRPGGRSVDI